MIGRIMPIAVFLLLGVLLAVGLKIADKKADLPSPLVGREMPKFTLPLLDQPDVIINSDDLIGEPMLINFWASWCVSCRTEAKELEAFWAQHRQEGIVVLGVAIQDESEAAKKFAAYFQKTYLLGLDEDGKASIDYGVSGVPETFLIDKEGIIRHKETGPVTAAMLKDLIPKFTN